MVSRTILMMLSLALGACSDGSDFSGGSKQVERNASQKDERKRNPEEAPRTDARPTADAMPEEKPAVEPEIELEDPPPTSANEGFQAGEGGHVFVKRAMAPCGGAFPILAAAAPLEGVAAADCTIACVADMKTAEIYQSCFVTLAAIYDGSCPVGGFSGGIGSFFGNGHAFNAGSLQCRSAAATGMTPHYK